MSIKSLTDGPEVWPKKPIVELDAPHVDDRGEIIPLVDAPMQSAVMITSKKGTVRANHYHKTDWHYCYVVSGRIAYYHRPTGTKTPCASRAKSSIALASGCSSPDRIASSMRDEGVRSDAGLISDAVSWA